MKQLIKRIENLNNQYDAGKITLEQFHTRVTLATCAYIARCEKKKRERKEMLIGSIGFIGILIILGLLNTWIEFYI